MSDHQEYEKVIGSIPDSPMVEEYLLCLVISLPNQYAALMSSLCGKPSILSDDGCQEKERTSALGTITTYIYIGLLNPIGYYHY